MPRGASAREVLFVAGEASGDLHVGAVAVELAARRPDVKLTGVGGGHLRAAGGEVLQEYRELAVMGFVEVLKHIPKHAALLKRLRARIEGGNVAAVVLVDYPGFNMKVAAAARAASVPVVYYVTPQVWAWGAKRLPKMARVITKAAVILPFEEALLRGYGIDATFVGHPLLDRATNLPSKSEARRRLGLPADGEVLALFPGSREQELARHLDDFVATARELERRRPGLRVVVSAAPSVEIDRSRCPYEIVPNASFDILRAADAGLCKSGTTTLEAAISDCPMAVGYRTGGLSYQIAKRVVKIPYIALVNVVAGRQVVREFIQDALRPVSIANELERLLADGAYRETVLAGLHDVRDKLGTPGAAARTAAMISDVIGVPV
jgi:lipid-A-disaccharide synthase